MHPRSSSALAVVNTAPNHLPPVDNNYLLTTSESVLKTEYVPAGPGATTLSKKTLTIVGMPNQRSHLSDIKKIMQSNTSIYGLQQNNNYSSYQQYGDGRGSVPRDTVTSMASKPNLQLLQSKQSELLMRKTVQPGSASAQVKLFQPHQKRQNQLLISINCSRAVASDRGSHHHENQQSAPTNLQAINAYGFDKASLSPNRLTNLPTKSPYHVDCKNGQSMLQTKPNYAPDITAHRKHSSYYMSTSQASNMHGRASSTSLTDQHFAIPAISNVRSSLGCQSINSTYGGQARHGSISVLKEGNAGGHNAYGIQQATPRMFNHGLHHKLAGGGGGRHREEIPDSDDDDEKGLDMEELFPKPEEKKRDAVMYGRAINKLKTILHSKGLKDSSSVLTTTNFGLVHFHIEAPDNNIELNRFETKTPGKPIDLKDSLSMDKRQQRIKSKYASGLSTLKSTQEISSHLGVSTKPIHPIMLHQNVDDSIDFQSIKGIGQHKNIDNFEILDTEDQISESLVKDSPHIKSKLKSNQEQFMMQVRSTMHMDDGVSQVNSANEKTQKTILFTKEVHDTEKDYLNMEIKEFVKLSEEELCIAYNRLQKMLNPVFSGGVNTLINKLDSKKVVDDSFKDNSFGGRKSSKNQFKRKRDMNRVEANLIQELSLCKEALDRKKMPFGLWSVLNHQGSLPHTREGATASLIGNNFYVFGGFSRDLFGDFRSYDLNNGQWTIIPEQLYTPSPRYTHTQMIYDKKIIVFGGAGTYMSAIRMRLCYNDIHIFDTESEQWLKEPDIEGAPSKRMSHSSSILGGLMLVHGGFNTEQKKLLNDFSLFDLELQKWIQAKVYLVSEANESHVSRIDDQHFHYDHVNSHVIGFRQMHSINAIFDEEYYLDNYTGYRPKVKRMMWLKQRHYNHEELASGLAFHEGFYLFGGVDQKGHTHGDLWYIEPHYEENEQTLHKGTCEFLNSRKQVLSFKIKKVTQYSGRAPCPRIMHGTTVFKDWNKHFNLVIYGGRNDTIYQKTQNVALNDICMLNLNRMEWSTVAMYGPMPCSRWAHCFTLNRDGQSDGFFIFGGVNLRNYCKSRVYQFQFLNDWFVRKNQPQVTESDEPEDVNEKLQTLFTNIRQKTDLIKEILNTKHH